MGGVVHTMIEEKRAALHRHFGLHSAWIEGSDVFGIRFSGPLEVDELRGILEWQWQWGRSKPSFFVLCDLSQLGNVSTETRRYLNEHSRHDYKTVSVCYGMSFGIRILVEMADRARRYLGRNLESELILVGTEAEARAYIEKRRA